MITVFKFFNKKHGFDQDIPNILPLNSEVTGRESRGHKFKLFIGGAKNEPRKQSFSMRVRETWNSLPQNVVEASDVKSFEIELDKFWENRDLVYNWEALHIAIHSNSETTT